MPKDEGWLGIQERVHQMQGCHQGEDRMSKRTMRGRIQWMTLDDGERDEVCPLLSIAAQGEAKCIGIRCAMWIPYIVTTDYGNTSTISGAGLGHCGFIHPGHEGLVMEEETDDDGA